MVVGNNKNGLVKSCQRGRQSFSHSTTSHSSIACPLPTSALVRLRTPLVVAWKKFRLSEILSAEQNMTLKLIISELQVQGPVEIDLEV